VKKLASTYYYEQTYTLCRDIGLEHVIELVRIGLYISVRVR